MPAAARILIVDDEVAQMEAVCETLGGQGYETVGFSSASRAIAALAETQFDLLLTDLMMPEMDGIALLREAQAIDPNLFGIIMTGQGTISTAVEAMRTGAFDYILKPFRLSVLLPIVTRALSVRRLRIDNADLERRISERTAELEVANRELEAFSYSVSHDLRAPLRVLDGFSKMLLEDYAPQLPVEGQRLLKGVAANAQRMNQLIDSLLHLSRLGRQTLSKQPVSIAVLVEEVLEELRKEQGDRRIEIRLDDLSDSMGDPLLLRQVFVNLLANAFKFTGPREEALIEVGCQRRAEDDVYYVRDNGVGFDMQYAAKLFGAFQRLHSNAEFAGTGIGLSIVQRIVHRHGGRVWAEGEVDKGAAFFFSLPHSPT